MQSNILPRHFLLYMNADCSFIHPVFSCHLFTHVHYSRSAKSSFHEAKFSFPLAEKREKIPVAQSGGGGGGGVLCNWHLCNGNDHPTNKERKKFRFHGGHFCPGGDSFLPPHTTKHHKLSTVPQQHTKAQPASASPYHTSFYFFLSFFLSLFLSIIL